MTTNDRALLVCRKLEIGYGGRPLVPPIDLTVRAGRVVLVVGRNGAGKSTWLKTALGLLSPVGGEIRLGTPAPRVSYVPQAAGFDPMLPLRARTVVGWGRLRGWSFLSPLASRSDRDLRRRSIEQADATGFDRQPFRDLSGGQKQRILLARLLASDVELALLDEPTASLDLASERDAYQRIAGLARDRGLGVVVVTHTLDIAAELADEILFLDAGERPGEGIAVFGPPEEVFAHPLFRHHFGDLERARG